MQGVIRKVDPLCRLVIPSELRNAEGIRKEDAVKMWQEGDKIIVTKAEKSTDIHCQKCNKKVGKAYGTVLCADVICGDCIGGTNE